MQLARVLWVFVAALVLVFSCGVAAHADKIRIATATCEEINDWKSEDKYDIFVFLLGYYGGMTKSVEIDDDVIQPFAKRFESWCATHRDARLLDNVRTMFEGP